MDLTQVLHMNGDVEEASYANNSLIQREAISLATSARIKAITNLYCSLCPRSLDIADLGCSSGPNALLVTSEIIKVVEKLCQEINHKSPEYNVFLNDLSGNDFNSIFKSLDTFKEKLCNEMETEMGPCYFFGVPGSFYGRLFPNNSLHLVHSSYSLHWLSKVPRGVDNNKGNIYITITSPSNVLEAYYEQFHIDFSLFLKCRAQEIVEGGCMILTFLGRESDELLSNGVCYAWEHLATALNDMVMEGIIEEEKLNTFNIPNYYPSPSEVKLEVKTEGSFSINQLEVSETNEHALESNISESLTKGTRAVIEPLLIRHFGESVTTEVFDRFRKIIKAGISKERTKITNLTLTLTRKA
ncbi:S-adenosyl-L-methionine:benzoic acid/salicylic acid carboxyl methyltransferase 3-like [Vicia villosa]|uniref:S-adenosyl-L-methionine:benzoic acid/salicylic acid carboxyl methyltransferase 3-like n=1 Tax=Vicia villosa TaxID=3911 RepID=UPI00273AF85E|nr:S-adenosyl-L-methionine:benzoic acid/salicylic acid carboxyl methyltransferase 3-like [Vicia villosa]XP_058773477.1 S-adenosyl-L-methionine:benzoic acid/salicylic acid carboxyl methyltransferase 3-like [Vicia villosa]